jgi:hypothetical protein
MNNLIHGSTITPTASSGRKGNHMNIDKIKVSGLKIVADL